VTGFVAFVKHLKTVTCAGSCVQYNTAFNYRCQICPPCIMLTCLKGLHSAHQIWQAHLNDPVKSARPDECWVQHILPVGSSHDNDTHAVTKAIHLVQCLVTLIIALCTSSDSAHCINLVYEDDGWRNASRLHTRA